MVREISKEKRARFLQAALKLFAEKGVQSTSTAEIAREAGTAAGTLFLYFPTKQDLIHALVLEISKQEGEAVQARLTPGLSARDQFFTIWDGSIRWLLDNPEAYRYAQQVRDSGLVSPEVSLESGRHFSFYYEAIQKGFGGGQPQAAPDRPDRRVPVPGHRRDDESHPNANQPRRVGIIHPTGVRPLLGWHQNQRKGLEMSTTQWKIVLTGIAFLLLFVLGYALSRSGKPYPLFAFTLHKLITLGIIAYLFMTIYKLNQVAPAQPVADRRHHRHRSVFRGDHGDRRHAERGQGHAGVRSQTAPDHTLPDPALHIRQPVFAISCSPQPPDPPQISDLGGN